MAPGVVQLLEVVEVHHQQRQRRAVAGRELNLALNHLLEGSAVVQTGQGIEARLLMQAALGLGDIHADKGEAEHRDADHREIVRGRIELPIMSKRSQAQHQLQCDGSRDEDHQQRHDARGI